jgi:hypothetical protein
MGFLLKIIEKIHAFCERILHKGDRDFMPHKTEDIVIMGHYAKEALDNQAFDYAFNKIQDSIIRAFKTSAPKDTREREHIYYRLEGLALIKLKLQGMFNSMLKEENDIKRQASKKEAA